MTTTKPSQTERPRDRISAYCADRLASLNARSLIECKEPTCGARDEDGDNVSCLSKLCGEKLMLEGWRRELQVIRDIIALVEFLERSEIAQKDQKDTERR